MASKTKITITVDKDLLEAFRYVLPGYVSMSGVIEAFIKEYMIGHYKHNWTLEEMVDVLRGRATLEQVKRARELGLGGAGEGVEAERDLELERARHEDRGRG